MVLLAGRKVRERREVKRLLDVLWRGEWSLEDFECLWGLACRQAGRESWVVDNGDVGLRGLLLEQARRHREELRVARLEGAKRAVEKSAEVSVGGLLGDARRLQAGVLSQLLARVECDGLDVGSWSAGELRALESALRVAARVEDAALRLGEGKGSSGLEFLRELDAVGELDSGVSQGDSSKDAV